MLTQICNLSCSNLGLDATKPVFGNFAYSKFRYDTFQKVNNKDADQSAWMRRLVCAFAVCTPRRQVFSEVIHTIIKKDTLNVLDRSHCGAVDNCLPSKSEFASLIPGFSNLSDEVLSQLALSLYDLAWRLVGR